MFKPEFALDPYGGWWFVLGFVVMNVVLLLVYPAHYTQRVFKVPDLYGQRVPSVLYAAVMNGTMLYTNFVTLKLHTVWFAAGITLFLLSAALFVVTIHHYATTDPNRPVTRGLYRYSRNPQQILAVMMWMGVSLASKSPLIFLSCLLQLLLMYPTFLAQERYCVEKYKGEYVEYMKRTPRYFWKW